MKVLLVDDSSLINKVVSGIFSDANEKGLGNFELEWAQDGKIAVELLKSGNTFDVILLDWNMPNLDGPGFLKVNKETGLTDTPIIMMTTEDKSENMVHALQNGASEYITKPFTETILLEKIDMVFDGL